MKYDNKVERFLELLIKIADSNNKPKKLSKEDADEFDTIVKEFYDHLISNPGGIILVDSKDKIETYRYAMNFIWKLYPENEILDDIFQGGCEGLMFNHYNKYVENARKLTPTFITHEPWTDEFITFYNEAMKCWLHGLNNSAVILCNTLLENILRDIVIENKREVILKLYGKNQIKGVKYSFKDIINYAYELKYISQASKEYAHSIRLRRNKIIHRSVNIESDETIELINQTKYIIEDLLN